MQCTDPFGMEMQCPWQKDTLPEATDPKMNYRYNGKEYNYAGGLGWLDYGARSRRDFGYSTEEPVARPSPAERRGWYDPMIGRWNAVDPMADDAMQVDKSPYSYAWNNPVSLTDPDGRCPWCIGAIVGAAVDYGFQVAGNLAQGQSMREAATNVDVTSILISAGAGAASGGLSVLTKGKNIGTLGKAALETTVDVTESVVAQTSEGDVSWSKTLTDVSSAKIGGSVKVDAPINTKGLENQADRTARIAKNNPERAGRQANAKNAQSRLNTANNINSATQIGAQMSTGAAIQNTADAIRSLTNGIGGNNAPSVQPSVIARDNTRVVIPIIQHNRRNRP